VSSIGESWMIPFLAIVTLGEDARVHVHSPDGSNESAKIKEVINQEFGFGTTLGIPYVKPDDSYVGLGGCFDDSWFGYKRNRFKEFYMSKTVCDLLASEFFSARLDIWYTSDF